MNAKLKAKDDKGLTVGEFLAWVANLPNQTLNLPLCEGTTPIQRVECEGKRVSVFVQADG